MEIRQPAIRHKLAFPIGGGLFACVSYFVGIVLFEVEVYFAAGEPLTLQTIALSIARTWPTHGVTFALWVFSTVVLFIALGYLFDKQSQLRRLAESLSVTDALTLLHNRRYLMNQMSMEMLRAQRRSDHIFAVLMIDIDDFKHYNDTRGHLAGDSELRRVALIVKQLARQTDIVARYGGEEIMVVAVGSDKEGGLSLAERIREGVANQCAVTVSIGVSSYPEDGEGLDALISAADNAMYRAKRAGKNQCLAASPAN